MWTNGDSRSALLAYLQLIVFACQALDKWDPNSNGSSAEVFSCGLIKQQNVNVEAACGKYRMPSAHADLLSCIPDVLQPKKPYDTAYENVKPYDDYNNPEYTMVEPLRHVRLDKRQGISCHPSSIASIAASPQPDGTVQIFSTRVSSPSPRLLHLQPPSCLTPHP